MQTGAVDPQELLFGCEHLWRIKHTLIMKPIKAARLTDTQPSSTDFRLPKKNMSAKIAEFGTYFFDRFAWNSA